MDVTSAKSCVHTDMLASRYVSAWLLHAGPLKENNSLASNRQVKGQKGQALMQAASGHMVAQPARRKLISTQLVSHGVHDSVLAISTKLWTFRN